jgi:hypothetical protein
MTADIIFRRYERMIQTLSPWSTVAVKLELPAVTRTMYQMQWFSLCQFSIADFPCKEQVVILHVQECGQAVTMEQITFRLVRNQKHCLHINTAAAL